MDSGAPKQAISPERRKALLTRIPGFAELPPNLLGELASSLREEHHTAGAPIVKEGEVGDRLYLIERGHVEVSTRGPNDRLVLTTLGPDDMFGEIALLSDARRRQATVKATEPLVALTLSAAAFQQALAAFPEVRIDLAMSADGLLAAKLRQQRSR
jgi:CRP-like cAMP-binding protein